MLKFLDVPKLVGLSTFSLATVVSNDEKIFPNQNLLVVPPMRETATT